MPSASEALCLRFALRSKQPLDGRPLRGLLGRNGTFESLSGRTRESFEAFPVARDQSLLLGAGPILDPEFGGQGFFASLEIVRPH